MNQEYWVFSEGKQSYIYFTNYKQAFEISDFEAECINTRSDGYIEIIQNCKKELEPNELNDELELDDSLYGLYLNISNTCNAKCIYCFAHQGNYGKEDAIMDSKIAIQAVDFFMEKVPKEKYAGIVFFGGEPLMAYSVIKEVCAYISMNYSTRKVKYSITTNATLMNEEMIDLFSAYNFKVAVSIDGGEIIQNNQRPLRNGGNCFYEATKNLPYLLKERPKTIARGTFCNYHTSLVDHYEKLINLGFTEVNIVPDLLNIKSKKEYLMLEKALDELHDYIVLYTQHHVDFPFGLFKMRIRKLFLPKNKLEYNCGIGKQVFSIDVHGDIFPCHRFNEIETSSMGNVVKKDFHEKIPKFDVITCKDCWNRYTCTHGCSYEDLKHADSEPQKNRFFCKYSMKMTQICIALCSELNEETLWQIIKIPNGME